MSAPPGCGRDAQCMHACIAAPALRCWWGRTRHLMSITPSWCPGAPRKRACALDPCPAAQSPLPARKLHALLRCMLCGHAILHVPTETQVRIGQKTFLLQAAPLAGSPGAGADNSAPPTLLAPASLALPAPAPVPRPLARVEAAPRALATTGSAALTLADPLRTYRHAHARRHHRGRCLRNISRGENP